MTRVFVLVMAVVSVLTACSTRVGGGPVAGDADVAPPGPEDLLGDYWSIDPCSLTDLEVLEPFGRAEYADPESLDYCTITVDLAVDADAYLYVGALDRPEPDIDAFPVEEEIDEGVHTVRSNPDEQFCEMNLVFDDLDLALEVSSSTFDSTTAQTCDLVTAAMDQVVEVYQAGAIEHHEPEADSLIPLDPCDFVDDATVTAQPGFEQATRTEHPAGHECTWEIGEGEARRALGVLFSAGPPPRSSGEAGSNDNPIAGRPSSTSNFPGAGTASFCIVETGHIPFEGVEGRTDAVEIASVYVRSPSGAVNSGCPVAVAIATKLWPELPSV